MPVESDPAPPPALDLAITGVLLDWYDAHARRLPWRAAPGATAAPDPYHIWLSEVMLQQTTVAAVIPYFERFVARWPDVAALAAADEGEVLAAWAGLGYYSRARNLIAAARAVVERHGGRFPDDEAGLRTLPGIGDYTAAAIAAFAFAAPAIPLDANLDRVLARLAVVMTPLPQAKAELRQLARSLWPARRGGDFAQALMDLGAGICTARRPRCDECPVARWCRARHDGLVQTLPVKPAKRAKPHRHGEALWISDTSAVWLVRRPPRGMLGGMRALPGGEWGDTAGPAGLGTVRHVFTHFTLDLTIRVAPIVAATGPGEWWPRKALDAAGLPTLYRRAAELAMEKGA